MTIKMSKIFKMQIIKKSPKKLILEHFFFFENDHYFQIVRFTNYFIYDFLSFHWA